MASYWQYPDYSAPEHPMSPSLVRTQRPLTPLILPRDWLDQNTCYPSADFGEDDDFQSNHLDFTSTRPPFELPSLSGLGIRNIDLAMDLSLLDNVSKVANIFDEAPLYPNAEDVCELDLEIVSRNRSENEISAVSGVTTHSSSGSISLYDSPWLFPSVLKAPELATNDSSTDLDSSFSVEANPLVAQVSNKTDTTDITLCLEELSAAAGLSLADFATQISATAEVALRNMAADGITLAGSNEEDIYDPFQFQTNVNDIGPKWFPPDFSLPFDSSVFRNVPSSWNNSCAGVNPADILPVQQPLASPPTQLLGHPILNPISDNDTPHNDNSQALSLVLQADFIPEGVPFLHPEPSRETRRLSDDEHSVFQSPSSSEYSPSLPVDGEKKNMPLKNSKRRITRSRLHSGLPPHQSRETPGLCDENSSLPINLGTPVFDAHRGIDIDVLKAKAERYRLRNQGREYDKRWLISFAGKLSPRGELMDEFRCYITGCKQTNKRRDHILIHVGAHLDQRPFKCMYCSSRFLRKNECKRHELSHTGIRPFSCHLCPYPSTTFVRQDLLKRHMKRTHRMQLKSEKENEVPDRPKKRVRS